MTSLARFGLAAVLAITLPTPTLFAQDLSEAELRAIFARQMQKFQEAQQHPGLGAARGLKLNRVKPTAESDKGAVAATEVAPAPAPPTKTLVLVPPSSDTPAAKTTTATNAPAAEPPLRSQPPAVAETAPATAERPAVAATQPVQPATPAADGPTTRPEPPAVAADQPAEPKQPAVAATTPAEPKQPTVAATSPAEPTQPTVAATSPAEPTQPTVAATKPSQPEQPAVAATPPVDIPAGGKPAGANGPETVSSGTLTLAATRPDKGVHVSLAPEDQVNVRVQFDFDSAAINADQKPKLRTFCKVMDEMNIRLFRIVGHTDASGSAAYNQKLSLLRAEEVKRFFTDDCGIAAERLEAIGVGEQFLADPQDPKAGANRRVEFQALS